MSRDSRVLAIASLLAVFACNEPSLAPGPPLVRDVLFRDQDGTLYLIKTDGMHRRRLAPPGQPPFTPLAVSADGRTVALLEVNQIAIAPLEDVSARKVVYAPPPPAVGPGAFSADARRLAVPCAMPSGPAVLLYDRDTGHWDTVVVGRPGFAIGPAFSPDGGELAGLGATALSLYVVRVRLSDLQPSTERLGTSLLLNAPVFGWPRWTAEQGFLFLARRGLATPGPDSLAVVAFDPDNAEGGVHNVYSVLAAPDSTGPDLVFAPYSTFALSRDGSQMILTAYPDPNLTTHVLWSAARGGKYVYRVFADSTQLLLYPHLLN